MRLKKSSRLPWAPTSPREQMGLAPAVFSKVCKMHGICYLMSNHGGTSILDLLTSTTSLVEGFTVKRLLRLFDSGGVPGVGKTQLGIQLAINVQIPVEYGGLGGKAVYIDTEGSFMVERVYQIAEGCISDILEYFPHCHDKAPAGQEKLKPESFLADIYYFRICSYTEQIAVINYLEKFLGEHKDVRIVIIDSVTFHFRQDFDDMALRTRVLSGLSLKLMKLSKAYNLAVVLLNQVTTKFTEGSFQLTLALGDSWSHSCTNRLILYWNGNERYGFLDKSPSLPVASAPYAVTVKGVRDAVNSNSKRVRVM
ncbi:DNA repair protein radA (radA)-like [Oryza sativa Japonica Group]|uniref:DNA repair protein RAD51 homolog 3 n=2 Tax=Oryza sativa subsp. japonica TaxID=39947 RepID=Q657Q9_ORYSJ|nr:DNA repair protein RAD51 homolog 3 isoform X2 [Oryza sativa Japonica Group]KAB8081977.1 hypothetical protein EE612_003671 [Oryza sativa]KAF2950859.1 hypothetical protein DAI22_01g217900 [Oryza sativa Japonica Group]BAD44952.1 DNA repair protein radA (radA)-like [Oryza sativa Japonica Group]BAD45123.1 DNA repair protein radA (radA)-like [Oryza sativa Japonica Group]BAG91035.1 unnamed protein product [Oryza sativa Japonica Group]